MDSSSVQIQSSASLRHRSFLGFGMSESWRGLLSQYQSRDKKCKWADARRPQRIPGFTARIEELRRDASDRGPRPRRACRRVSRGQAAVLAQITAGLTRPTSTDEVYGQVVTAVAEQLGSVNTALCSMTRPATPFRSTPATNTGQ